MNKRGLAELQMAIGENMRVRCKSLHITQEQLAERARLSVNYIARLEVGMRAPSLEHERSAPSAVDQIAACLAGLGSVESDPCRSDAGGCAFLCISQEPENMLSKSRYQNA